MGDVMVFDRPRRSGLEYGFTLVLGITVAVVARLLWRCRLASELILAFVSRGDAPQYRHHVRWRR